MAKGDNTRYRVIAQLIRVSDQTHVTLLAQARFGGAAASQVYDYLQSLGDADPKRGRSLIVANVTALVVEDGAYVVRAQRSAI